MGFFLHIGFSKCASTWLQSYLKNIPNLFYLEKTGFFNLNRKEKLFIKYYESFFENANANDIKVESDEHIILPDYHPVLKSHGTTLNNVDEVITKIKNSLSNVKIILVIRNQYDLIISRYSQYIVGGGTLKFRDFVKEMLYCSYDGHNYYQNYYAQIISKLYKSFGRENVLVLLQEQLHLELLKTKSALDKFLGVTNSVSEYDERNLYNQRKGLSLLGLKTLRIFNKIFVLKKLSISSEKKTLIPAFIYTNLIVRGIRFFDYYLPSKWMKSKKQLFEEEIIIELRNLFSKDNEKLSELMGTDLKKYGYN